MDYGALTAAQQVSINSAMSRSIRSPSFSIWMPGVGDVSDYVTWIDIDRNLESPRGRGRIGIGTATLFASNEDETFYADGVSQIEKNARVKIWLGFDGLNTPVFTGVVKAVKPKVAQDRVEIACTDYMGLLSELQVDGSQGDNNTPKLILESFADDILAASSIATTDELATAYNVPKFEPQRMLAGIEEVGDSVFRAVYFDNDGVMQAQEREYSNPVDWVFNDTNVSDCLLLADSEIINSVEIEYAENYYSRYENQHSIDEYRLRQRRLRTLLLNYDVVSTHPYGATAEQLIFDLEGFKITSSSDASIIDNVAIRLVQDGASGYLSLKIYSDSSGPDTLLATSQLKAADGLATWFAYEWFYYAPPFEPEPSTVYWVVIDRSDVTGDIDLQIARSGTNEYAYYDGGWNLLSNKRGRHHARGSRPAYRVAQDVVRFYKEPKQRIKLVSPGTPHLQIFDEVYVELSRKYTVKGRYVIEGIRQQLTPDLFTSYYTLREA